MREVFQIGYKDTAKSLPLVMNSQSSQPGYLELTADQIKRLIKQEPIENHYEVEDQPFARGKYATVRRCRDRTSGRQYAAKFLRKRRRSADLRAEILHEVAVLEACKNSPRIVKLHEVFESAHEMVLVLELACGGELQMLLDRDEVPSERQVVRLMRQILDGLIYLHSIDVAHLDIKPQNLVLTGEFPDCDVKLCDFGISRYLSQGADIREILGTPDYVAPEVLNYESISLATDMWSVGVLMYVLLTGCSPFGGDTKQETFCNIAQCRLDFPDDLFDDISQNAKDLMSKLMVKNPSKRLSAKDCLQHPWFTTSDCESKLKVPLSAAINETDNKPTKPRTPVPSKKPIPAEEQIEATPVYALSTSKPKLSSTDAPVKETSVANIVISSKLIHEDNTKIKGLSAERRKTFRKSMECLVERFSSESKVDHQTDIEVNPNNNDNNKNSNSSNNNNNNNSVTGTTITTTITNSISNNNSNNNNNNYNNNNNTSKTSSNVTFRQKDSPKPVEARLTQVDSFRSMTRASGMQTMPVSGLLRYQSCNVLTSKGQNSVYQHRGNMERDTVFKFRRVYIIDDSEEPSPPPSINGSLNSDSSSISDSNSDTVSEMSIDSSSDRSSIISLDDSLDLAYSKGRHYSSCYNVWEAVKSGHRSPSTRVWPRECNGSFARALSRFSTQGDDGVKEGSFHRQQKPLTVFKNANNNTTSNGKQQQLNGNKCIGLELMQERNGNLVVIREVKAINGSKYARCSEVKCESVQSRIRRLQVHTEFSKDRFNVF